MEQIKYEYIWALLRLLMGWLFFWSFIDKLLGLGFGTCRDIKTGAVDMLCKSAWINGGSPTFGFLKFATKGPFAEFYQGLAGNVVVDWLFMLGLLFVGVALLLGITVRIAASTGAAMLLLMYAASSLPPEHNPFLDYHLIFIVIMMGLMIGRSGRWLSLHKWWQNTGIVRRFTILK